MLAKKDKQNLYVATLNWPPREGLDGALKQGPFSPTYHWISLVVGYDISQREPTGSLAAHLGSEGKRMPALVGWS